MDEWDEIFRLINPIPLKPIVCLGKGRIAVSLVEEWPDRVIVVDRSFSTHIIAHPGVYQEVWGNIYAPWQNHSRLIADFREVEFKQESIGAVMIPELLLVQKEAGLKILDRSTTWLVKNGIVVVRVPTLSDIRFRNFKSFGATRREMEGQYKFQEISPGNLKVDPPIPCDEGCAHEYFSFYHPSEIQQRFPGFKECINSVFEEREGSVIVLYVAQKTY